MRRKKSLLDENPKEGFDCVYETDGSLRAMIACEFPEYVFHELVNEEDMNKARLLVNI